MFTSGVIKAFKHRTVALLTDSLYAISWIRFMIFSISHQHKTHDRSFPALLFWIAAFLWSLNHKDLWSFCCYLLKWFTVHTISGGIPASRDRSGTAALKLLLSPLKHCWKGEEEEKDLSRGERLSKKFVYCSTQLPPEQQHDALAHKPPAFWAFSCHPTAAPQIPYGTSEILLHHVAYVGNPGHVMTYWRQASPFHLVPPLRLLCREKMGEFHGGQAGRQQAPSARAVRAERASSNHLPVKDPSPGTCNHFPTKHYAAWRLQADGEECRELSYWSDSVCFLLIWKYKGNLLNYADGKQINRGEGWAFTKAGQGHWVN